MIEASKHHIYVENQYLASSCAGAPEGYPQNLVFDALLSRLRRARSQAETFRITMVLTLPEESDDVAKGLIKWLFFSISRGQYSLMAQLRAEGWSEADIKRYLTIVFLRSHAILPPFPEGRDPDDGMEPICPPALPSTGMYAVEQRDAALRAGKYVAVHAMVFVHSKFIVVDDKLMLCGSANFNDRSFMGDRDSELCTLCSDDDLIDVSFGGVPARAGRKIHEARVRLMENHTGILWASDTPAYKYGERASTFADPLSPNAISTWDKQADRNAFIYRSVFPGGPPSADVQQIDDFIPHPWRVCTDTVEFSKEVAWELSHLGVSLKEDRTLSVRDALAHVEGHLYRFPVGFLDSDRLQAVGITALNTMAGCDITQ